MSGNIGANPATTPGGPHTALQEAASLYTKKTGVPVTVHFGPQAKWNDEA